MSDHPRLSPLFDPDGPYHNPAAGAWAVAVGRFFRDCADRAAVARPADRGSGYYRSFCGQKVAGAGSDESAPAGRASLAARSAPAPLCACECVTGSGRRVPALLRVNGLPRGTQRQFAVQLHDWPTDAVPLPADCRVYLLDPEVVARLLAAARRANIRDVFAPDVLAGNAALALELSAAPALDGEIGPDGTLDLPAFPLSDDYPDAQELPPGAAVVLVVNDGAADRD